MMVSFFSTTCNFPGCNQVFTNLEDLIVHIEEYHIDSNPKFQEQCEMRQPSSLPLSLVNRFLTDAAKRIRTEQRKTRNRYLSTPSATSLINTTSNTAAVVTVIRTDDHFKGRLTPCSLNDSLDSDMMESDQSDNDTQDVATEDSDESMVISEDQYTTEFIMRMVLNNTNEPERPYQCPVPGCRKKYKNINGIKYHARNGHGLANKLRKEYKCHCGKSYKTGQGLRQHMSIHHPEMMTQPIVNGTNNSDTKLTPLTPSPSPTNSTSLHSLLATSTRSQDLVKLHPIQVISAGNGSTNVVNIIATALPANVVETPSETVA